MADVNVFISHSWAYSGHYDKLAEWLFDQNWSLPNTGEQVRFVDWSVPKDNPIHNAPSDIALGMVIFSLIANCHVVVIPTGMYANYSQWINNEIAGAKQYGKPVLAVDLWGAQRTSSIVQQRSTEVVGWRKQSVADAVWRLSQ